MATKSRLVKNVSAEPRNKISCYICYARLDGLEYAKVLTDRLRHQGVNVFVDDDILPGEKITDVIQNKIQHADFFILIGTPAAFKSEWVKIEVQFFYREMQRSQQRLLPIMFRGLSGFEDIPQFLQDIQWLQEDKSTLRDGPSEQGLSQLFHAVQYIRESVTPIPTRIRVPSKPEKKRPLNEGKLILVGRGEVGKTSLVRRLTNDEFRGDESKTQGINITDWKLLSGSDILQLNVWDFGGQEIMHATHQFFLTERSLYILVLNGREGGEDIDAEYWLKLIESFGGDSPVIIVQNKIVQHPFELNYRGLQTRYPQIHGFVKTDCKDAVGIDDLRQLIQRVAAEMPEIRMQFPADWFAVKDKLSLMVDDFMGFLRFRQICESEGIQNESDRDTLCWVLHCLGIALNYRDDPRLRETSVLKPEWVTNGIYKIINAKKIADRQGELRLSDLNWLLPRDRYPLEKHLFLLELMRKFSLCFAFPDEEDRYLIPELLGKEEPKVTEAFVPDECLNFEYHYAILPEGLIPRFIVRSHTLSRNQERWRSGVILSYEGCKALVTAVTAERRVIVRVMSGDAGARRRLLAIIRYDVDRINREFKDRLDAQPKVPLTDFPEFSVDYHKLVAFERQGVETFPEFIGQNVVSVDVNELLNGIDLATQREEASNLIVKLKSVFFSYSHKDESLRDELETHLKLLQRQSVISTWHDRKILPGTEWDHEIDQHLERARIILLLISADFIASDYCWEKEVKRALERHESGEAVVIPVMLRSCDWQDAPFAKLQGLPKEMKPVKSWPDRDAAWTNVATGIREVAQALK
ncbi:MAG: leucine-rich repeat-containing protein [Candidatus Magnetoglobus multicellularis str. Araruama]|uniref:non-specific serine/threonine protein kinase n=1 Tax=Candidatus Magnetoglobus multicellularis str. Araruama TaxID=890399 RepID=A0A1V1PCN7_9BACT|nr:MAG: leucine-rich repeat-containing protein [Candidatus Magnetoglobus multicellularis str. Araruama]